MKEKSVILLIFLMILALVGCDSKLPNGDLPFTVVESGDYYEAAYPDHLPYIHVNNEPNGYNKIRIEMAVKRISVESVKNEGNQTIIFINSQMDARPIPETKVSYVTIQVKDIHNKVIIKNKEESL